MTWYYSINSTKFYFYALSSGIRRSNRFGDESTLLLLQFRSGDEIDFDLQTGFARIGGIEVIIDNLIQVISTSYEQVDWFVDRAFGQRQPVNSAFEIDDAFYGTCSRTRLDYDIE